MKRNCEVCGSRNFDVIYTQKFILENDSLFSYKVGACGKCGFTYASNLPSSKKIENFYKKNVKYAYQHNEGSINENTKKLHLSSFIMIDKYLKVINRKFYKSKVSILDIGCATGYLLSIFKNNKYKNLLGIDPAPECSLAANKLYKIKVLPSTLSEFNKKEKFDAVIFASVLEHLSDLEKNLLKATKLVKEGGVIFISVPDGNNFGKILREPFLEFSIEHINYFTKISLKNLFSKYGFKNILFESMRINSYGGYALNSLWTKSKKKVQFVFDQIGKRRISNYIKKSSKKLEIINNKITKLIKTKERIVIWGVGSLTSRLLATTDLKKANIQYFVDSNSNMQGKKFNNLPVKLPKILKGQSVTVFVSTYIFGEEIKKILLREYNFKGQIILI